MAKIKYAYQGSEGAKKGAQNGSEKTARAAGRSLQISPKHAVEICRELRGMYLDEAKDYLEEVIEKKRAVPFKRHNKKVGHRRGLTGWAAGRYPVKAATEVLSVLVNAEANAEYSGMDTENLKIIHISSHRGYIIRGYIPRAFGRATPFNTPTTHLQVVLGEAENA